MNQLFADFPQKSRVHRIPSFDTPSCKVYVKREDELGILSMGIKVRKYLSLIPFLCGLKKEIALVGGPFSNNVLALCMLLKENKIPFTLFLKGKKPSQAKGNFFFLTLLCNNKQIIWAEDLPFNQMQKFYEEKHNKSYFWLPEGASCKESFAGALTLSDDILRNQNDLNITFDHIFVDSGTGFTAASTLIGLKKNGLNPKVHAVLVAGTKAEFTEVVNTCLEYFADLSDLQIKPVEYHLHHPDTARSFGSITKEHLDFIKKMADSEGMLLDPIYNAKLFLKAKKTIESEKLQGNILIINSGGSLSLSGFSEKLHSEF